MNWNAEYYEILDRYYWMPERLACMRKIDLCDDCKSKRGKTLPQEMRAASVIGRLKRQEVPLNDIFNLFFRIAPRRVPGWLFPEVNAENANESYEVYGQEILDRYGAGVDNVTQQDLFFVGQRHLLAVELKIGAKSELMQIAKYALLFAMEEEQSGKRERLSLVYLTPDKPFEKVWREGFEDLQKLQHAAASYVPDLSRKPGLRKWFGKYADGTRDVLGRMSLSHTTYPQFGERVGQFRSELQPDRPGDETLINLIDGLLVELAQRNLLPTS